MAEITTVIEARPKTIGARLLALWQYRIFYPMLFKEISMKKFRDTFLGFWWLIIRPLIPTTVIIVIFTFIRPMDSGGLPYPIFFLSGFITWNVFHSTIIFMPRTLLWMQGLMRRTYFPKLLVPLAAVGPPLIELAVTTTVFVVVLIAFAVSSGRFPIDLGGHTLWFAASVCVALMFGVAIGMVTSVVALFFRDVVFSVSYFAQMFMFLTPVIYPVTFVPESYRWILYLLNPMATVVEVSRWSLTGQGEFVPAFVAVAFGTILLAFVTSVAFFLRAESFLADEM